MTTGTILKFKYIETHRQDTERLLASIFIPPPPPQTVFVSGYTVFTSGLSSVTFCFLNIFKSHGLDFIKPCILIHIYRANTYNEMYGLGAISMRVISLCNS